MRSRSPWRRLPVAGVVTLAVFAAGCGSADPGADSTAAGTGYPVTVTTCGHTETYDGAPERVVTTDVNMIEGMIALGLQDKVVGTFTVDDDTHKIGEAYRSAWEKLDHISDNYPEMEPLVALDPDFVFTGWAWGLNESKNITPETLKTHGIKTYILGESCDWGPQGTKTTSISMDVTYDDLLNLGRIFGVQDKAEKVVADMRAQIADVEAKVADAPRKKVFLYDAGDAAPFTAGGISIPNLLIEHAGGSNIFGDEDSSWMEGSWEAVVAAQPDCIILNDYGQGDNASTAAEWKQRFLSRSPVTKDLPAVKDDCILSLDFDQITPGPTNAETVELIARWLHPEAFA